MPGGVLFHFSEDPTIERFVPHVPATNPTEPPAVWAIEEDKAPLYWFPRDCPRVTVWPRNDEERPHFEQTWQSTAPRVHYIEARWVERMRTVALYRYDLPADTFRRWEEASGQWVSRVEVVPLGVSPVGDLFAAHERAGIELRIVDTLLPIRDRAVSDAWDFSIVRMMNAV